MRASFIVAIVATALICAWLLSGLIGQPETPLAPSLAQQNSGQSAASEDAPTRVRARVLQAQLRTAEVVVRGTTQAKRFVEVRAMVSGKLLTSPAEKGTRVKAGDVLCRIDPVEREAWVAEADAALRQTQLDYEGTLKLQKQGLMSAVQVAGANARHAAAQANLKAKQVELDRTRVTAPFAGVVEDRPAELGAYLQPGQVCVTLIDPDPMQVVGQVAERDVEYLSVGQAAVARLLTGEHLRGIVTFIGLNAQSSTRTYRIEMTVPNPTYSWRSGLTADMRVAKETLPAHQVSPAILALDDSGNIGVRIVDDNKVVRLIPVKVVSDDPSGVWVAGLPEVSTIITVGQETVVAGERVDVTLEAGPGAPMDEVVAQPQQPKTQPARSSAPSASSERATQVSA